MTEWSDQNTEFVSPRHRTLSNVEVEAELDRRLRDAMRDIFGGTARDRTVRRIIAYGEVKPAGTLAKRLIAMRRGRKSLEDAERLVEVIRIWVREDLYGQSSGAKKVG